MPVFYRFARTFCSLVLLGLLLAGVVSVSAQAPDYKQPYRPQVHFSPDHNWTNDPNGLVYFNGEYHLFFQYNPFGDEWGHMSWGHAVSKDLLHWKQLPVAIPEEGNTMIFTGSVVVDRANTSGFCESGKPCLVAVYTGHTQLGKENGQGVSGSDRVVQTQNLAWSRDDGRTWTKYSGNPVLDLHMADFRDPSVFFDEREHHWIMAVSLPKEHKVRLYSSSNLKQWAQLSDFGPLGDTDGDWECPDLLHIPADNGKGAGTWALKVGLNPGGLQGGSGEQYFLGNFDGKQFTAASPKPGWTNYGKDDYCAISFNGIPHEQKPVLIGWMNNWQYAAKLPTAPWRGQFSMPRRLSVLTDAAGTSLKQTPVTEPLRDKPVFWAQTVTAGKAAQVTQQTAPYEMVVHFVRAPEKGFGLRLRSDETHWTDVGFDAAKGTFYIDRTHSGLEVAPEFPGRVDAPTAAKRGFDVHLVVDRASVEAFAQDGTIAMTDLVFPPTAKSSVEVFSADGSPVAVKVELWAMEGIW